MSLVIEQNFIDLGNALERLHEALVALPDKNGFVIDSTIHRYKYCIALFWKNFKNFVEMEGKEVFSPKQATSEAYRMKWLQDEKIWLNMLLDRNLMSHTYKQVNADAIYERIKEYYPEMRQTYDFLKERFKLQIYRSNSP